MSHGLRIRVRCRRRMMVVSAAAATMVGLRPRERRVHDCHGSRDELTRLSHVPDRWPGKTEYRPRDTSARMAMGLLLHPAPPATAHRRRYDYLYPGFPNVN